MVVVTAKSNYRHSLSAASEICALVKQRIAIPWLWHYHNLPGDPKPGGGCRSPFYDDNHPDFCISRDGSRFIDWGEPEHKGSVIDFEMLASRCTRARVIRKLRELASLPENETRRLPVNTRSQRQEYQDSGELQPMTLDFLEIGGKHNLKQLAELRGLSLEALQMASDAGVLRFATLKGSRAWVVTDQTRYIAEARRLDGKVWAHIDGAKSYTLPGGSEGRKRWPLGILEAQTSRAIALVEGGPDFLAAFHWIWLEERFDVAPVGILGASNLIHRLGLPFFHGKRVRIFPHYDEARFDGFDAARKWEAQLQSVGAVVDCFDLSGLTRSDDRCVCDLNDLCSVTYEQWQNEIRRQRILP
jgi:hypothetical protein